MRIKRLFLYILVLALVASPVLGGYGYYDYKGYVSRDPSLIFEYTAKHHLVKDRISGTAWSQAYTPTNRNRTNSAGLLEAVAANTPAIDHVGASLEPYLRLEPAATYYFLNSATPVTQDCDVLAVKHTVCLIGTGSATISAGTATIAAGGAATDGTPFTVDVTGAGTITVTIAGSPTRVWLTNTAMAHSYVVTAGSTVTRTTEANTTTLAIGVASGGTVTYSDGYLIHTFLSSGTFTVAQAVDVEYLVVAGGGSGGAGIYAGDGGGGAGGMRTGTLAVTTGAKTVTVGGGGASKTTQGSGISGEASVFDSISSAGGGGGGANITDALDGGSGGGAGLNNAFGTGNTPPTTPSQGNDGGRATTTTSSQIGGGGGGAGAVGGTGVENGTTAIGGIGGAGAASSISGAAVTYAGGGGGGGDTRRVETPGAGGAGGGGAASITHGVAGTANTGGGGGSGGIAETGSSGAGGSGIVIVRYVAPTGTVATMLAAGTGTIVIKGKFAFARAAGVVTAILSSQAATASLAYTTTAAGNLSSFDGTTVAASTGAYTANTDLKIAITFPSSAGKYRIGVDADGAGIVQGTEANFDGAFTATTNLILGYVLHGATWIKWIKIYDKVLTNAQINAM